MCSSSENPFLSMLPLDVMRKREPTILVLKWIR